MKLQISLDSTSTQQSLIVSFNNQTKELFSKETVEFFFSETGLYEIELKKRKTARRLPLYMKIIHCVIMPIRGIINYYFDEDDYDWKNDIQPFCIVAKIKVLLNNDEIIHCKYTPSRLKDSEFTNEHLEITPKYEFVFENELNIYSVRDRYFAYVRKNFSVMLVSLLVTFLLFICIYEEINIFLKLILFCFALYNVNIFLAELFGILRADKERKRLEAKFLEFIKFESK